MTEDLTWSRTVSPVTEMAGAATTTGHQEEKTKTKHNITKSASGDHAYRATTPVRSAQSRTSSTDLARSMDTKTKGECTEQGTRCVIASASVSYQKKRAEAQCQPRNK